MSKAKLISHTVYFNGCGPIRRVEQFRDLRAARTALADILRSVRRDLTVLVLKDGPGCYLFTNVEGERVFERTLRVQA